MTPGLFVYKKANLPRMFSRFAFVLRFKVYQMPFAAF